MARRSVEAGNRLVASSDVVRLLFAATLLLAMSPTSALGVEIRELRAVGDPLDWLVLVGRDPQGRLWYARRRSEAPPWEVGPLEPLPGGGAFVATASGREAVILGLDTEGRLVVNRLPADAGDWVGWRRVAAPQPIRDFSTRVLADGIGVAARTANGELSFALLSRDAEELAWQTLGAVAGGPPTLAVDTRGRPVVALVTDAGELAEFQREGERWTRHTTRLPVPLSGRIALVPRASDETQGERFSGLARTREGELVLVEKVGGEWGPPRPLQQRAGAEFDPVLFERSDGSLIAIAADPEGRVVFAAEGAGFEWNATDLLAAGVSNPLAAEADAAVLFAGRNLSEILQHLELDPLEIEVASVAPSEPWEDDTVTLEYRLRNRSNARVQGVLHVLGLGRQSFPLDLPPGGTTTGTVSAAEVQGGHRVVVLRAMDESEAHTIEVPGMKPIRFGIRRLGEAQHPLLVHRFSDALPTDAPPRYGST